MLRDELPCLSMPTDTVTPITPVPIFYIHEGEHPFCLSEACICHAHEAHIRTVLMSVMTGVTKMRKVYDGVIVEKGIDACQ